LSRASVPPPPLSLRLDEDGPAIVALAPSAADKHSGTYKIPNLCVNPVNTGMALDPSNQEIPAPGGAIVVS
jgi:hypothetical protein